MKIKLKIWVSVIISVIVSTVLTFFVFRSVHRLGDEIARGRHYSEIIHKAYALDLLVATFGRESEQRHIQQFNEIRAGLTKLLEGLTSSDVREEYVIRQIRKNNQEMAILLDQFLARRTEQEDFESDLKNMLAAQLWIKVRTISEDTSKLMNVSESRIVHRYNRAGVTVVFLLIALITINVIIYLISGRSIARAHENLQKNRELLQVTLASIGDAVIATDVEGRITFMNPVAEGLTGWTLGEASQKPVNEVFRIINENTRKEPKNPVTKVLREGAVAGLANHTILIRKDGTKIPVDDSGAPIKDKIGNLMGVILVFRDITERKRAEEALRESQTLLRAVMENTPDPVYVKDDQSRIIMANPALAKVVGRPLEEILGRTDSEYYGDPHTGQTLREHDLRVMKSGWNEVTEETVPTPQGRRTFLSSKTPYRNASGDIIGITGISRDITERKQAEEALRRSEERYRTVLESIQEGYFEDDLSGNLTFVNDALCRHLGYTREELMGMNYRKRVDEKDAGKLEQSYRKLHKTGEPIRSSEATFVRKDGTKIIGEFSASLIRNSEGKPTGFRGVSRDITERKRAEEALQSSEEKFSKAFRNSPNAITITRLSDGKIIEGNESAYELFGYTHEEVLGKTTLELDIWANVGDRQRVLTGLASRGFIQNEEFVLQKKDKAPIYVNLSASLITIDNQQCFLCSFIDITERKHAEEALRQRTLDLHHLTETLEQRVKERTADVERERRRLYDVLETVPAMVCLLTPDYHVSFANRSFREKFGESNGRHCYEYCFGRPEPCEFCESYNVLETGKPHHWEVTTPDGVGVIDAYDFPFTDVDGSPLILEMDIDITDRKRAEEALKEKARELADLSSQLVTVQENERRRVSYDLHDNVWQMLLAIRFGIESLFSGRDRSWETLQGKAKEVEMNIMEAVGKIRSMQGDLWPYVLDDIGIMATIDWYCREFEKDHSGLSIENLTDLGEHEVPSSAKIVIYRILQETLNNVTKHSRASHATIRLRKGDQGIEFTTQDNGIGFDPEEAIAKRAPWGGLGLLNIKARTELAGGIFEIESAKGKGTTVRASWNI